jgi:hypothetical protein
MQASTFPCVRSTTSRRAPPRSTATAAPRSSCPSRPCGSGSRVDLEQRALDECASSCDPSPGGSRIVAGPSSRNSGSRIHSGTIAVVSYFQPRSRPSQTGSPGSAASAPVRARPATPLRDRSRVRPGRHVARQPPPVRKRPRRPRPLRRQRLHRDPRRRVRRLHQLEILDVSPSSGTAYSCSSDVGPTYRPKQPSTRRRRGLAHRSRTSSNSDPGAPAVEITTRTRPPCRASPPTSGTARASLWRWSSSITSSGYGMIPSPVPASDAKIFAFDARRTRSRAAPACTRTGPQRRRPAHEPRRLRHR